MERILAIGAHPDDIEIDCAGTVARAVKEGKEVFFYILTNGERGGNPQQRRLEALKSAGSLGVRDVLFENLGDCMLRYEPSLVGRIKSVINSVSPDAIYTHSES